MSLTTARNEETVPNTNLVFFFCSSKGDGEMQKPELVNADLLCDDYMIWKKENVIKKCNNHFVF